MRQALAAAALIATFSVLSACTSPPEPPLSSPAPKLDPDAIAYDKLDFQTNRPPLFDNTCKGLPSNLQQILGLQSTPRTPYSGGCFAAEQWGSVGFVQDLQSEIKSEQLFFSDTWNGRGSYTFTYFERAILAERYYAVYTLGNRNTTCLLAIDTGSQRPLRVQVSTPDDEFDKVRNADQELDARSSKERLCTRATDLATKLLKAIDPNGGSRKA